MEPEGARGGIADGPDLLQPQPRILVIDDDRDDADGEHHWDEAWRSEISTFMQYAVLTVVFVVKQRYGGDWRLLLNRFSA